MNASPIMRVVVFLTRGVSLRLWDEIGMFEREVALYKRLQGQRVSVSLVTYGDKRDLAYSKELPGIRILCNRWRLSPDAYERWLTWLHWSDLCRADLYKTNQTNGAEVALWTARRWKKPVVARCGYMLSEFSMREAGQDSLEARRTLALEEAVFQGSTRIVVTTASMRENVARRLPSAASKTRLIPNHVDTSVFKPLDQRKSVDLIFVGRLHPQKNIGNLLHAWRELNGTTMHVVGNGLLAKDVRRVVDECRGRLRWDQGIPNGDLPTVFAEGRIFVLPSLYEGHPKTLIEAMACGLPVIGANSPGIREMIRHGETGWLCGTDAESIRAAIKHLLNNPELCRRMGANARRYAVEHFALDKVVEMELAVYREVLDQKAKTAKR
jgi:glycosyltransferase involved in cell wall biosynthesis